MFHKRGWTICKLFPLDSVQRLRRLCKSHERLIFIVCCEVNDDAQTKCSECKSSITRFWCRLWSVMYFSIKYQLQRSAYFVSPSRRFFWFFINQWTVQRLSFSFDFCLHFPTHFNSFDNSQMILNHSFFFLSCLLLFATFPQMFCCCCFFSVLHLSPYFPIVFLQFNFLKWIDLCVSASLVLHDDGKNLHSQSYH